MHARVAAPWFDWFVYARAGVYVTCASIYCSFKPISPSSVGKVLRLYGIGRVFESCGGIITFYLFLFTSFSKSFFIVLFATYSVNVNFRNYSYMLTVRILYFHAITWLPHTHALCMTQDVIRYVKTCLTCLVDVRFCVRQLSSLQNDRTNERMTENDHIRLIGGGNKAEVIIIIIIIIIIICYRPSDRVRFYVI